MGWGKAAIPPFHYGWVRAFISAMPWKRLLAYITGSVDQELLVRNEYLVTENRILRAQIRGRLRLTDGERKTLAVIGKQLGKKALEEVASIVKPDTILAWHRRLNAKKSDGSKKRKCPGRPSIDAEVEKLILRFGVENKCSYMGCCGPIASKAALISDISPGADCVQVGPCDLLTRRDSPAIQLRESRRLEGSLRPGWH